MVGTFGSGRHRTRFPDQQLIENNPSISIYWLNRHGALVSGAISELRWWSGQAVSIRTQQSRLLIQDGNREQTINFDWLPIPRDRFRPALLCPSCGQRRIDLHLSLCGAWVCRWCSGLKYSCRHRHRFAPGITQIEWLRRQLGASDLRPFGSLPPRPLHNRAAARYDRLVARLRIQEDALTGYARQLAADATERL